ncbi:hypothetical protein V3851_16160 [Paenibacillus sp. M1]|uniref:Uncharacterized protein n=1 Tax=Paenibacillus haidiansis TaxID=1574488 RepID=A0ABU7VUF3_9BACL
MLKFNSKKLFLQEEIVIDPYIPIEIKWGDWNEIMEGTHYFRLGDFKKSLLEIGVGSNTGIIRSVTLVETNKVSLNSVKEDSHLINNEYGVPVFDISAVKEKGKVDVYCNLEVNLFGNKLLLKFREDEVDKCIHSGRVIFGANKLNELCYIKVAGLSDEETMELKDSLSYL